MRSTILFSALLLICAPLAVQAMDGHAVRVGALKWEAGPPQLPPGGQGTVVFGDPSKPGPYVVRFKAPAGYKIPPHTHPTDEAVTILSGSMHIGTGPKFDMSKGEKLGPGDFINVAAGMQHYVWFSEPGEIQVHGVGPFDITYLNPADDPRKSTAQMTR